MRSDPLDAIQRVSPLPHVVSVTHEGETILLDAITSRYFRLNGTGGRIWSLLCEGMELTAVAATMADEYGVDLNTIRADLTKLISQISAAGIVACS